MAKSGSVSTNSYSGRYYKFSWTQSGSNISWKLEALGASANWVAERTVRVTINGSQVFYKTKRVERTVETVATGKKSVGSSFTVKVEVACYASTINLTANKNFTLDAVAQKSILSVNDGTLGVTQTLTVTRKTTGTTHTITYKCGSASGTICTKSSSTSISFTPPASLASQNTSGTSLSITYTIRTYSGSKDLGSYNYQRILSIPGGGLSVVLELSDEKGYADKYGGYILGQSRIHVKVNATSSYDARIESYRTIVDYLPYTSADFSAELVNQIGATEIKSTVRDSRGQSATAQRTITVLDYREPVVLTLEVRRCDADGVKNEQGDHVKVDFSASVTSLGGKNSSLAVLSFKKTTDTSFRAVRLTDYTNQYDIAGFFIFAADTGSSYDVELKLTDDFSSDTKTTSASTAFSIMHIHASGLALAFGKIATILHAVEFGWKAVFSAGVQIGNSELKDFVVESGTWTAPNGFPEWTYRKWDSGIAECSCKYSLAARIEQPWGSVFYGYGNEPLQYPIKFLDIPKEIVTMRTENNAISFYAKENAMNTSTHSGSYVPFRPTKSTGLQSINIDFLVIGKWKVDESNQLKATEQKSPENK